MERPSLTLVRPETRKTVTYERVVNAVLTHKENHPLLAEREKAALEFIFYLMGGVIIEDEHQVLPMLRNRLKEQTGQAILVYINHLTARNVPEGRVVLYELDPDAKARTIFPSASHHTDAEQNLLAATLYGALAALFEVESIPVVTKFHRLRKDQDESRLKRKSLRYNGRILHWMIEEAREEVEDRKRNILIFVAPEGERSPTLKKVEADGFINFAEKLDQCTYLPVAMIPQPWHPFGRRLPFGLGEPGPFLNIGHRTVIRIGQPIETFGETITANRLMYALSELLPPERQGDYPIDRRIR